MRELLLLLVLCLLGCRESANPEDAKLLEQPWEVIEVQARGSTVQMMMWQGDPYINAYMNEYVKPALRERYGIELSLSSGQGSQIVNVIMAEQEAGRRTSSLDMGWINGETFYQLRQLDALYGPFTETLPNGRYINWESPFIAMDFQQPVNGMEAPWGNVQLAFIYDSLRAPGPPRSFADLSDYIRHHPGTFTIPNEFTGMTLLKSWMIALSGQPERFEGAFDEAVYAQYSGQLWDTLNALKPYLWKEGGSFPETLSGLHQMFANGEVDFTFSNNDSEVDNKIALGFFPETARAYVPEPGTIRNSHFLGIFKRGTNKAGALLVINFLLSPEAQWKKMDPRVWGDGTVLALDELPADWRARFAQLPGRRYAPDRKAIRERALLEPAPEYMIRLYDDFRTQVLVAQ